MIHDLFSGQIVEQRQIGYGNRFEQIPPIFDFEQTRDRANTVESAFLLVAQFFMDFSVILLNISNLNKYKCLDYCP